MAYDFRVENQASPHPCPMGTAGRGNRGDCHGRAAGRLADAVAGTHAIWRGRHRDRIPLAKPRSIALVPRDGSPRIGNRLGCQFRNDRTGRAVHAVVRTGCDVYLAGRSDRSGGPGRKGFAPASVRVGEVKGKPEGLPPPLSSINFLLSTSSTSSIRRRRPASKPSHARSCSPGTSLR